MRTTIMRRGHDVAIKIPDSIMQAARFEIGQEVEIHEEDGRIVIEPGPLRRYDLAELVAGITPENRHDTIDFGDPVGREAW